MLEQLYRITNFFSNCLIYLKIRLSSISPTYVEIVENTIYDPDIGSQKAIAVLDADTSHGVWSYGNYAGIPISIQVFKNFYFIFNIF